MTQVILDGPGLGMTTTEYKRKRDTDCQIGRYFGWINFPAAREGYVCRPPTGGMVLRDDPGIGMPYFSFDMNGAWEVVRFVIGNWSYPARQKFWELLQRRAGMGPVAVTYPAYPEALESLSADLHEHICCAFLEAAEYHRRLGIDPKAQSPRAAVFSESTKRTEFTETLEDGREAKRLQAAPTNAPWVH